MSGSPSPNWWTFALDPIRTAAEAVWLQGMRITIPHAPHVNAHGVIVIPGFMGNDNLYGMFRRWLVGRGYRVDGWGQGVNRGPRPATFNDLAHKIRSLADDTGEAVSVVGHSLGGIYAREIAKDVPREVRQVITLGSPLGEDSDESSTPVSQLFNLVNPGVSDHWRRRGSLEDAPPVPTTAVFSYTDGIVAWPRSVQYGGHDQTENIAIVGSHGGMLHNAMAWRVLADRLGQKAGEWAPYEPADTFAGTVHVAPPTAKRG